MCESVAAFRRVLGGSRHYYKLGGDVVASHIMQRALVDTAAIILCFNDARAEHQGLLAIARLFVLTARRAEQHT